MIINDETFKIAQHAHEMRMVLTDDELRTISARMTEMSTEYEGPDEAASRHSLWNAAQWLKGELSARAG